MQVLRVLIFGLVLLTVPNAQENSTNPLTEMEELTEIKPVELTGAEAEPEIG